MHDFLVFRTVSGPYDVPLDDPKPRFGQQRRKIDPALVAAPHSFMVPPSILRGISSRSSKRDDVDIAGCRRRRRSYARGLARARTRARPCALPRCALVYIPLNVPSPIPHRHMPPRLGKQLSRTPWRSRSLVRTLPRGADLFRSRYRPSTGVEPSGGGPPPDLHTLYARSLRLAAPMSSHIPLQCARAGLLLGASVGALSSRCDTAA